MSYIGNSPGVASQRVVTPFTATAGQTSFTPTSGYTLGYCDVFLNGIKLANGDDYTAADGTTVVLAVGAALGDFVEVVAYFPRGLSDGYLKAEADARFPRVDTASQGLTSTQQGNARTNINAVNKAGDTMTGALQAPAVRVGASSSAYPQVSAISAASADFLTDASIYALGVRNDNTATNNTAVGIAFGLKTDFNAFIAAEKNSASTTAAADLHFGSRPSDSANFRKHMTVSQSGAVTKPLQPSIVAYMAADQTISGSAWTKINIDTALYSQGGMSLDTTNKRIYVPVSGVYLVSYTVHGASTSSEYLYSGISVGGTFYFYGEGRRATGTGFSWQGDNQLGNAHLVKLTANSYVELNFYSTGGGTTSGGTNRASLGIHLLS